MKLQRTTYLKDRTLGELQDDEGKFICRTLEPPLKEAIPTGDYHIRLDRPSPKFSKYPFYQEVSKGCVPYLENVKGHCNILIHCGAEPSHTQGCILVGEKVNAYGNLSNSREAYKDVWYYLTHTKEPHIEVVK